MRLIDADALKERAIRVSTVKEHCYFKAVGTREIDKAPTIDAVPVVRCKECKNWMHEYDDVGLCVTDVPDIDGVQRLADDFCSYGERRDNENNS